MYRKILHKLKYVLYLSPIILGMIGYFGIMKYSFWESLYGSLALYFVNPTLDGSNGLTTLAEFLAIIVTANFLLIIAKEAVGSIGHVFINRYEDSTAVYGDEKYTEIYVENSKHSYIGKSRRHGKLENAKNHIIMFKDDMDNINFLNDHDEYIKDKEVFVQLNEIDSFLLGKNESNIHYFNIYEIIARKYWKENPIDYDYLKENKKYKIAIVGYDFVGKAICRYGIMNNLYFRDQQIEYHIWNINRSGVDILRRLELMNDDSIVIHDEDPENDVDILAEMDRIILASEKNLILVQALLYKGCQSAIYYFADETIDLGKLFNASNIVGFGDLDLIVSDKYIRREELLEVAKLINLDYIISTGKHDPDIEDEWRQLTGFVKGSNVARADHYAIEKRLAKDGSVSTDECNEIEHIRWCRYHFINNWTYDAERDNSKRKHNLLVAYCDLPEKEKAKSEITHEVILRKINELM